ncbi:hypothetical protein [Streptomyces aurantiogriseus]|uniref:Uncharacterized protein n=1 Tax=Streptomyces aurantiogriseus TaxID=66870 RepID=A0A918F1R1_9ACTN|nr:hypothetical protein GCM10010251_13400 [Streptomyces aurantiogriseus]
MLIKHLPRDSALNRDLYGEAAEWSVTDHLLAAAVDHLAAANWMFACVNSAEDGDQPEPPVPVPRPGDGAAEPDEDETGDAGRATSAHTGPGTGATRRAGAEDQAPSAVQLARFFA